MSSNTPKTYLEVLLSHHSRERRESGYSDDDTETITSSLPSTPSKGVLMTSMPYESRRESYDSGLSESPPRTPNQLFTIDLDEQPLIPEPLDIPKTKVDEKKASSPPRRKKKKKRLCESMSVSHFSDVYRLTGEVLGEGSYGKVETCSNIFTNREYAVKIISKQCWHFSRPKILKEIELYHLCQGRKEIIQMIEYFEENENFYLVFEKAEGGPLLDQIQRRVHFTEKEAATIIRDLASALAFLHSRGIAHRDLKPENVLCSGDNNNFLPIKLCDFDLCSAVYQTITTPKLQSPVGSVEYMAPEVVEAFAYDLDFFMDQENDDCEDVELTYDKRCDLWSLGIIAYILLCGYLPFSGSCGRDCGWEDRGEECQECQQRLFQSIKSGSLVFPEQHWSGVSKEAKDLIAKLLVRDASQRLDASSILDHPWIVKGGECGESNNVQQQPLETPCVLRRRHKSVHEALFYSEFPSNALAIKRNCDETMKKSATIVDFQQSHSNAITPSINIVKNNRNAYPEPWAKQSSNLTKRIKRQASLVVFSEDLGGNRWEF